MNAKSPIFIIGGSRTGSEMLKTMLSTSQEVDFVDELFLHCPGWLHTDLEATVKTHLGDRWQDPDNLNLLLDVLFSGEPYGWFWRNADTQLDRRMLESRLADKPLDMPGLFLAIMQVHAEMRDKNRIGAKFPMHYSESERLLEWFPECKFLHTTRNPKAVYASQSVKYLTSQHSRLATAIERFKQFVHINIQTTWTASVHRSLRDLPNYLLVRYEDVVTDTRPELERICDFLGIRFQSDMLDPHQYGSSFDNIGKASGVDPSSLDKWRSTISPVTATLLDWMHLRARALLGYGSTESRQHESRWTV